ncbi:MAG: hypothetical protein ACT4OF_08825 [Caulobacteraceae bacterium]
MAQAYETRHRRNGAIDLREDVTTLQKDLSQLTNDIGNLITLQWNGLGEHVNGGLARVGKQVRARPIAAVGVAAGVGLLAGLALSMLNRRGR